MDHLSVVKVCEHGPFLSLSFVNMDHLSVVKVCEHGPFPVH